MSSVLRRTKQNKSRSPLRPRLQRSTLTREIIETIIFIIAVYALVEMAIPRFEVDGPSMEPTFETSDRIVVSRLNYMFGEPEYGNILVFNSPRPRTPNEAPLIKRVIGLPGDTIELRDRQVYRNGELLEEPYVKEDACFHRSCGDNIWELADDEYFMMGDNRNQSNDSRSFGPVSHDHVIGEGLLRFWPLDSLGVIKNIRYDGD